MALPKIVFVDRATIPANIQLPPIPIEHEWVAYETTASKDVVSRLQDADVVITNKVVMNADVLSQLPKLRLVAVSATGVNNVDLDYCREHHIAVTNIQGYATRSVPEHVIGMIYALKRNFLGYHSDILDGEWKQQNQFCFFTHPIRDVAGSTLGIIGSGSLGQATAALAKAVGMNVLFAERKGAVFCRAGYLPFEQVLIQSDIVTLHCPLTETTRNLIGEQELAVMPSHALLINAGRGGLVNEVALVHALKTGQIAGAGVDVFTDEPADESNPLLANAAALPNLLLTPHVAWGSESAIKTLVGILVDNIVSFLQGGQKNRVV